MSDIRTIIQNLRAAYIATETEEHNILTVREAIFDALRHFDPEFRDFVQQVKSDDDPDTVCDDDDPDDDLSIEDQRTSEQLSQSRRDELTIVMPETVNEARDRLLSFLDNYGPVGGGQQVPPTLARVLNDLRDAYRREGVDRER